MRKRQGLRRIFSLLLAAIMVCALLPTAVFAADTTETNLVVGNPPENQDQQEPKQEEAPPAKPQWSDIRDEMQKVSVHVTCINPDVEHTDKTYPYEESTNDTIGYVQDNAGSYTCTVAVHLGGYRLKYNQDFPREHQFASSLTADVVLQYNGTDWKIISDPTLELSLTCGAALTPDPPGQDVLGRLLVQVECDAITYHFTKTYQLDDGDYELKKVDDNTYTVTVTADRYVEKYNIDYGVHTLFDNNTKTIKLVYRYGAWTVVGSNGVTFNVSCEQKYTVTYTDGVDGEVIFADQVSYKKPGEKTPAFNGKPTRKGYTFVSWTPKVTDTVTKTVTYTATWKANSGKDNVPKTGDSGIVPVLGSVLLFSFCGVAACVFDRKRKHV